MIPLSKGQYTAYIAQTSADVSAAMHLRAVCFRGDATADDWDAIDETAHQVIVKRDGRVVCTYRLVLLQNGAGVPSTYAAQFYDLHGLQSFDAPMLELGRFCIDPDCKDADVMRIAWGFMTRFVDQHRVGLLFGCSSFEGTRAEDYLDSFAMLHQKHIAPKRWLPRIKAPKVFRFRDRSPTVLDRKRGLKSMPPLLRTYLSMGGWVSDHAVVDQDLGTLHIFTGVEVAAIPPARARLLRMTAT